MSSSKADFTKPKGLRAKTNLRVGGLSLNHDQTVARAAKGLRVKTNTKAGLGMCAKGRICQPADPNHNQTIVRS